MTDECRVAFEKWCVDVAGYTSGEVATRILHSDKYLPAIEGDWITWQAAWNSRRAPDARTEALEEAAKVCEQFAKDFAATGADELSALRTWQDARCCAGRIRALRGRQP